MKRWALTLIVDIPDECESEHVEAGTREAMEALDAWRVQSVEAVPMESLRPGLSPEP